MAHILVVDDDGDLRALLKTALERDGHQVVYCGEEALHLTRSEYAICAHLAAHPAQTFTKEQIYEAVFGFDGTADSSAITEHIKNIRAKLRAVGLSPIQTVWGVGYKWESA